jgi:hypothetical protein
MRHSVKNLAKAGLLRFAVFFVNRRKCLFHFYASRPCHLHSLRYDMAYTTAAFMEM